MENVRAMLYHSKLPLYLWAEAVATVVGRWYGVKPNAEHLRIFGCTAYVHVPDEKRRKLDAKAFNAIFVGYPDGSKG